MGLEDTAYSYRRVKAQQKRANLLEVYNESNEGLPQSFISRQTLI